jgi:hypothetical protein
MDKARGGSYALHGRITRWAPVIGLLTLGTLVGGGAAAGARAIQPAGNGPSATDTSITLFPGLVMVGQQSRVTATVTPTFGMPTGWVDFYLDGTPLTTCRHVTLLGPVADCRAAVPTPGEHTIAAWFTADDTTAYAMSAGTATLTATKANAQLVVLPAVDAQAGRPFRPTVLVVPEAPGSGHPSGTITLTDNAAGHSCTITLPATSCALPGGAAGDHDLHARYLGDTNFTAAEAPAAQSVQPGVPDTGAGRPATAVDARPATPAAPPRDTTARVRAAAAETARPSTVDSRPSCGAITAYWYCAPKHANPR